MSAQRRAAACDAAARASQRAADRTASKRTRASRALTPSSSTLVDSTVHAGPRLANHVRIADISSPLTNRKSSFMRRSSAHASVVASDLLSRGVVHKSHRGQRRTMRNAGLGRAPRHSGDEHRVLQLRQRNAGLADLCLDRNSLPRRERIRPSGMTHRWFSSGICGSDRLCVLPPRHAPAKCRLRRRSTAAQGQKCAAWAAGLGCASPQPVSAEKQP